MQFYSVSDIIAVLTDSEDELAYWRKLKQREPQLVTICHGLKLLAKDGKLRYADCVNTKNAFRLIQSIPSKKAEPFKMWLAQLGKERIEEIENPELAQNRVKEYKKFKGLKKPNQNLRDHMTDWELILTMVGEKATTDITISKDARGFKELGHTAKEGGTIAKHTRKELEKKIGKSLISNENYLYLNKKKKKLIEP